MKGIKYMLFGMMFILVGGFFLADPESNLGGFGEMALLITGFGFGIKGLNEKE